mmetsp:Transcript_56325/g.163381  ORF Transcript_56325/g.163381 Transcript_56325/m.163381 type:complete len:209 (+) Transcript_56325:219-845(+)
MHSKSSMSNRLPTPRAEPNFAWFLGWTPPPLPFVPFLALNIVVLQYQKAKASAVQWGHQCRIPRLVETQIVPGLLSFEQQKRRWQVLPHPLVLSEAFGTYSLPWECFSSLFYSTDIPWQVASDLRTSLSHHAALGKYFLFRNSIPRIAGDVHQFATAWSEREDVPLRPPIPKRKDPPWLPPRHWTPRLFSTDKIHLPWHLDDVFAAVV